MVKFFKGQPGIKCWEQYENKEESLEWEKSQGWKDIITLMKNLLANSFSTFFCLSFGSIISKKSFLNIIIYCLFYL